MRYRAEDFPLYLLSLSLTGLLIAPILPQGFARVLLLAALLYLGGFFLIRHGAKFESSALRVVLDGVTRYPAILARSWWTARHAVIPTLAIFLLALAIEYLLRPSLAGTRWLDPFPWWWLVWVPFLLITAFRAIVLVAHLHRAALVRQFMDDSPQKKSVAVLPIQLHIFQAFVTGMLAHLSLLAPCVLFYMLTDPSYLREGLLLTGYVLWVVIARPLRKRKLLDTPALIGFRLFYQNHVIAHESRFYFTVLHGQHHDSIPSAMIGSAGGTGFLENTDRAFIWLDPLQSIVVTQLNWAYQILFDMVVHQYIPGIFPFAKITVLGAAHHMTHHFGSALPIGMVFRSYVESRDLQNGYKPDNPVTRWFLDEVERREGLDPKARKEFLSIGAGSTAA